MFFIFLISSYLYQYHYRYSIYGAESYFRSSRELAEYIGKEKNNYKNVQVVKELWLLQYAFFNKVDPRIIQDIWGKPLPKIIDNVSFIDKCLDDKNILHDLNELLPESTLYITRDGCHKFVTPSAIIKDVGEPLRTIWKIYEKR